MNINKKVLEIEVSDIRKIAESLSGRNDVINMTIGEPDLDIPNEIKEFRNYMRKCISMNFTLEEKECIAKKKKEIKEAGEAIRRNNGGKNPILGF